MRPRLGILLCAAAVAGCTSARSGAPPGGPAPSGAGPVWAVDLLRTLPGRQAEYLRNITANWAGARVLARERGAVRSYRALAADPDAARGRDVLLVTEYADSAAFAAREATFRAIFADPRYVAGRVTGAPSAELRAFVAAEVVMRSVAGAP